MADAANDEVTQEFEEMMDSVGLGSGAPLLPAQAAQLVQNVQSVQHVQPVQHFKGGRINCSHCNAVVDKSSLAKHRKSEKCIKGSPTGGAPPPLAIAQLRQFQRRPGVLQLRRRAGAAV